MRKIVSKKDRKNFYSISLYIVVAYLVMFAISLTVAVINYEISKYVNDGALKWTALILSTIHSFLIIINWFALKLQKSRIEYVKDSKVAWLIGVIMDILSTISMVCNTVTALINGGVLQTDKLWLLSTMSFITFGISVINFAFAFYFLAVAKKAVKTNQTL